MEERIQKSCDAINKLSGVLKVTFTPAYCNLKLEVLRLTHEFEERKYQDWEEWKRLLLVPLDKRLPIFSCLRVLASFLHLPAAASFPGSLFAGTGQAG
jgi:hypothetical protein